MKQIVISKQGQVVRKNMRRAIPYELQGYLDEFYKNACAAHSMESG